MSYRFTDDLLATILELAGILVVEVEDSDGDWVEYVAEIPVDELPGYLALREMAYLQRGDA